MNALTPVDPAVTFHGLEAIICDARSMTDALANEVFHLFEGPANADGRYLLTADEGQRLLFLASMALAISGKAQDAYYLAHANQQKAKGARK